MVCEDYRRSGSGRLRADLAVTYRLNNTGNIRVQGRAVVRARGPLGLDLGTSEEIEVPELLPGAEVTQTRKVSGVFPAGWVTGQVSVNPESSEGRLPVANRRTTTGAVPWGLAGLVAAAAVGAAVLWLRRRRSAGEQ